MGAPGNSSVPTRAGRQAWPPAGPRRAAIIAATIAARDGAGKRRVFSALQHYKASLFVDAAYMFSPLAAPQGNEGAMLRT